MQGRNAMFSRAAQMGVRFVLGTDASGYFVRFGQEWEELQQLTSVLGYTPEQSLRAATSDAAADAIGLGGITGRLTAGLGADFVIMRGNPCSVLRMPPPTTWSRSSAAAGWSPATCRSIRHDQLPDHYWQNRSGSGRAG